MNNDATAAVTPEVDSRSDASEQESLRDLAGLWWLPLVRGVLLIAVGGYALLTPGLTLVAYTTVLGVFVLLDGLLALGAGIFGAVEERGGAILRGVIGLIAGLFVLAHPALVGAVGVVTLVMLLAIQSIVGGVIEILTFMRNRTRIDGGWWPIAGGLLSILFGGVLLSSPLLAAKVFIQILGVFTVIAGIVLILMAFRLRSLPSRVSNRD